MKKNVILAGAFLFVIAAIFIVGEVMGPDQPVIVPPNIGAFHAAALEVANEITEVGLGQSSITESDEGIFLEAWRETSAIRMKGKLRTYYGFLIAHCFGKISANSTIDNWILKLELHNYGEDSMQYSSVLAHPIISVTAATLENLDLSHSPTPENAFSILLKTAAEKAKSSLSLKTEAQI